MSVLCPERTHPISKFINVFDIVKDFLQRRDFLEYLDINEITSDNEKAPWFDRGEAVLCADQIK
jgi:hypothetical protein